MWQTHAYLPTKLIKKRETDLTISIKILTKSIKMKEKRTFFAEFCRRIKKIPPDFGKQAAQDDLCEIVYQCLKKRGCAYFEVNPRS
jgi:hypothetical protein